MNDRLTVLVRVNSLELGGTQINAVDFAVALRAHGIDSHLIGPRDSLPAGPSLVDVAAARGVELDAYDPPGGTLAHARELTRRAREVGAELVHVYGTWGGARPTYWGPCLFGRRPWVHTVYEMAVDPVVHQHVPLVVGTRYLLDDLRHRPGPTVLVSPPVDLETDRPGLRRSPGAVAFVASLRSRAPLRVTIVSRLDDDMKALPVASAIDAVGLLARPDVVLVVVGTGDAEQGLRGHADVVNARLGWPAVELVGALADPAPAYASADVILGMGGSAARALAFGVPLVVQGPNGWSCLFEAGTAEGLSRNSYWSPDVVPDHVERLVGILGPLLDDEPRRRELGALGRSFAERRFGLAAMADVMAEVYRMAQGSYSAREWFADLRLEARRVPAMARRWTSSRRPVGGDSGQIAPDRGATAAAHGVANPGGVVE